VTAVAANQENSAGPRKIRRFTFVDVILWSLRIMVLVVVVGGTIGTLIKGRYTIEQWFDFLMFGLTIGGVYALIALGYTMVSASCA
jgi:branched-chain amino acid transport system permease protein